MTWVAAAVASASLTASGVQYIKNKQQAKKDAANRPQAEIPVEAKQNLSDAQQAALQGLPQEQYDKWKRNIEQSGQFGMSQLGTRKSGLAGISAINRQQDEGFANLGAADSQARMMNKQNLYGIRTQMGDYKQQQWQLNKLDPYNVGVQRGAANRGTLAQNVNNGLQLGASTYMYGQGQQTKSLPAGQQQNSPEPQYDTSQAVTVQDPYGLALQPNPNYNSGFNYGSSQKYPF